MLVGGAEQLVALGLVGRAGDRHIGDAAQEGDVVSPGVGRAVGPDDASAVQRKQHRQLLQGHIVYQLVVGALQKSGVDRHHRLQPLASQPGGEGDGVLLGNAHIVVALGEALMKLHHARAFAHGRGDAHQALVVRRHVAQPAPKHLAESETGRLRRALQPDCGVELARPVVSNRVGFGQLVALAFFGHHVQELRPRQAPDVLQHRDQGVEVVAVDRSDVVEAKFFEQGDRQHQALGPFFEPPRQLQQRRRHAQHLLAHLFGGRVKAPAQELPQVAVQRPHRRADRHVVVVEDHQQLGLLQHAGVVERLEGHAGGHGAVTDHGHRVPVGALLLRRHRHAQRGRNAGG